jgi:hypothetical protein
MQELFLFFIGLFGLLRLSLIKSFIHQKKKKFDKSLIGLIKLAFDRFYGILFVIVRLSL